jgi:ferredoxin
MKGYVDKDICIGCEFCPNICPEVFRTDDDGKAIAADVEISDDTIDFAKESEQECPVEAITIK